MDPDRILLTGDIIRILASETRIKILKKLAERRMTTSELSRDLKIAKSTVHEHLVLLTSVDLIIPVPDEHQWKYYEITRKGENLIQPENTITVTILLTSAGFIFMALSFATLIITWLSWTHKTIMTPCHGGGYAGDAVFDFFSAGIGIILLFAGILVFILLFRVRAAIKSDE
ncbi:ArsR/SmtB family transcription factor [Methanogenium cariaci]